MQNMKAFTADTAYTMSLALNDLFIEGGDVDRVFDELCIMFDERSMQMLQDVLEYVAERRLSVEKALRMLTSMIK